MKLSKSLIIGTVVVAAVALAIVSSRSKSSGKVLQSPSTDTLPTQTKTEGPVTIAVTPLSLSAGEEMRFAVSLDTHSIGLSEDLSTISWLGDGEDSDVSPVSWTGDPPGGHHREGELVFPARSSLPRTLTLIIQSNTMGAQEFRWNLWRNPPASR